MEALLCEAANVQWRHGTTGSTALVAATLGGHSRAVHLLLRHGADPNEPTNAAGISPLLAAAMKDRASCAHMLLMAGADLKDRSPHFGTASMLAAKKGHQRTLAVLEQPLLCRALQRLSIASALTAVRPMSTWGSRQVSFSKVYRADDAVLVDLPYDVLVQIVELISKIPATYRFSVKVLGETATRHPFRSSNRKFLQSDTTVAPVSPKLSLDASPAFCSSLGREQFLATRTSTMDPGDALGLEFDAIPGGPRTSHRGNVMTMREDRAEPKPTLMLEFEVPTPSVFRRVIELYYGCVAPEKDAVVKGAEAIRLAARQQEKLCRQHAPQVSAEAAQQLAFRQIFTLLQRKYKRDPLRIWRQSSNYGAADGFPGATSVAAAERNRAKQAVAEASQANAESVIVERELVAVQQQIKNLN